MYLSNGIESVDALSLVISPCITGSPIQRLNLRTTRDTRVTKVLFLEDLPKYLETLPIGVVYLINVRNIRVENIDIIY